MGRRQWETVVASAAREKLMITMNTVNVPTIAVDGVVTCDLFAPAGTVGRLQAMFMDTTIPSAVGAISGTHEVVLTTAGPAGIGGGSFVSATYPYNQGVMFNRLSFYGPPSALVPNDASAIVAALKDVYFDAEYGLRLHYTNMTDKVLNNITIRWFVNWVKKDAA